MQLIYGGCDMLYELSGVDSFLSAERGKVYYATKIRITQNNDISVHNIQNLPNGYFYSPDKLYPCDNPKGFLIIASFGVFDKNYNFVNIINMPDSVQIICPENTAIQCGWI